MKPGSVMRVGANAAAVDAERTESSEVRLAAPSPPDAGAPAAHAIRSQFARELALHTDGIGSIQIWHCLNARGVWPYLEERGENGTSVGGLARRFGANRAYLQIVLRHLGVLGWLSEQPTDGSGDVRVELSAEGLHIGRLLERTQAAAAIVRFLPVASRMAAHLFGSSALLGSSAWPRTSPELSSWVAQNRAGWGLAEGSSPLAASVERLRLGLEGNLLGPVVVAFADEFHPGPLGAWLTRSTRAWELPWVEAWARKEQRARVFARFAGSPARLKYRELRGHRRNLSAAFELLRDAGWVDLEENSALLTEKGAYAAPRAWAYGVPVSYLPLFGQMDELLFGEHRRVLGQVPGKPERHVNRRLNVKASGASHGRYFAAADRVVLAAFDRPFAEQPRGFADMGSGDGAWLEHVWQLISRHTERGRLLKEFPERLEYRPLMVGIDVNRAARRATSERLTRAQVPHLVLRGDVNDPAGVRATLARHGIDSRDLLHGNSFLIHNRPYCPPLDASAAARRSGLGLGSYVSDGALIAGADLQQNLVEFFRGWGEIVGRHGLLAIELHAPERVRIGKTLTNYLLTHGLSDQLSVNLSSFLEAAREAGLEADPSSQRLFPADPTLASISVNHFRPAPLSAETAARE
ncbi:MAG TPA: hypothetical protein VG963_07120 [Polyangiaceae bacterium]|nr:hypothetical protein [Polyangiaceae bacterium]